jgi:hypothetical protein
LAATDATGQPTGYRAQAQFGAAANGVSFGRHATSVGIDYPALSARTFGVDQPTSLSEFRQGSGLPNAAPALPPVVINEIMYHPTNALAAPGWLEANEEFVELYNRSEGPLDLYDLSHRTNRWQLAGAMRFVFPEAFRMAAGEFVLLVGFDPTARPDLRAAFRQKYAVPAEVRLLGPFDGYLNNGGERLELLRPDRPQAPPQPDAGYVPYLLTDQVDYRDAAPWPAAADGLGSSLQRRSPSLYGNEPLHWKASDPTPGRSNVVPEDVDRDGDGMPDVWETNYQLDLDDPADGALDPDGDGQSNLSEYLADTDPRDAADRLALEYAVTGDTQQLRFTAQPGRSYTVQSSDNVSSGIWFKVVDVLPVATAHAVDIIIPESPAGVSRVYRVVMPAQP